MLNLHSHALGAISLPCGVDDLESVVRGIVQHLNLQPFSRPVQVHGCLQDTLNHMTFIVNGQLYSDARIGDVSFGPD